MDSARRYRMLVFFTAFCCLLFELIISRVATFYLGPRNSYLAIPITFLGLALGSFHAHFSKKLIERFNVKTSLALLGAVSFVTLFVAFVVFTQFFPIVGAFTAGDYLPLLLRKTVVFVLVFVTPFYVFGRILTVCYHLNRERIGAIYSADLFGASLACFITPILFHYVSLPEIIVFLLGSMSILLVAFYATRPARRIALAVVLLGLSVAIYLAIGKMEQDIHFLYDTNAKNPPEVHEITSRWNEFSRTQLVRFDYPRGGTRYKIIHDDARSNVNVTPYVPGRVRQAKGLNGIEAPFVLGMTPQDIFVMFAGCGAEMVELNEYAGGKASITGVELNPLCKTLAAEAPELAQCRLAEFYQLPNIDLEIIEGRNFLIRNTKQFDMIYVGSSAPTNLAFTGHTRKYLYTKEAFELYLKALKTGGVICFEHQPTDTTVQTFKRIFVEQGREHFDRCVVRLRSGSLLYKPDGFTQAEIDLLMAAPSASKNVVYAPFRKNNATGIASLITSPPLPLKDETTDDRPYVNRLDFERYSLRPDATLLKNADYYSSWIKITTMLLLSAVAFILIALANASRTHRLPWSMLAYLLITGFCYLLIEVAFIAKLELFLQNPLVSMSCVVSIFLVTTGLGSLTFEWITSRIRMKLIPFIVAAIVFASILVLGFVVRELLGLPLWLRIAVAAAAMAPVGWALGVFYPYAVRSLTKHGYERCVPITYGISTLSSVVGATYSMTMMIEWGFNNLLAQAAAGYVVLGFFILLHGLVLRKGLFAGRP
ncbi:MAG TPA: hypothetical protein PLO37_24625 [Candidatus Hydrogenedentes bacterium]|nr:hypothetical protein [Candidatus Hydrogenedentota bacterium]HPG70047.1 hypothetical protein [Candidatus Hydrogenedentota bacterium]